MRRMPTNNKLIYGFLVILLIATGTTLLYLNSKYSVGQQAPPITGPSPSPPGAPPLPPEEIPEPQKSYIVVTKKESDFYGLAEYFASRKNAELIGYQNDIEEVISKISLISPIYLALVLPPEDITPDYLDHIDEKLRELDQDPFLDVAYGIITAFNVRDGYEYVERLLNYSPTQDLKVYGINPKVQLFNMLDAVGIDTTLKCTFTMEGGFTLCTEEAKTNVAGIAKDIKDKNVFTFNLHGEPTTIYLDDGEVIEGSKSGLTGIDKNGNIVPISFNSSLVIANSCMTARVNGRPSEIIEEGWDSDILGIPAKSIALSFLKSGALNYIGAPHYGNLVLATDQTLVPQSIIEGRPIGLAIKDFKNWYIYNSVIRQKDIEAAPRADERTLLFLEYQLKNWILFGDPSLVLSTKKNKANDCIREYSETLSTKEVNGEMFLLKNVQIKIKFYDKGLELGNTKMYSEISEKGEYLSLGCAVTIPLESDLIDYSIALTNINPRYKEYFGGNENIILNSGDELILIVPTYVVDGDSSKEEIGLGLTIQMKKR